MFSKPHSWEVYNLSKFTCRVKVKANKWKTKTPTPLRHSPKFRKTSFAWIAGQSFTRNGMAMYIPSNQRINFLNRNHNPDRLQKRRKPRKTEVNTAEFLWSNSHNNLHAWCFWKSGHLHCKQKLISNGLCSFCCLREAEVTKIPADDIQPRKRE